MRYLHHTPWDFRQINTPLDKVTPTGAENSKYWETMVVARPADPTAEDSFRKLVEPLRAFASISKTLANDAIGTGRGKIGDLARAAISANEAELPAIYAQATMVKANALAEKELVFERVRTTEFPNAPSRARCLFVLDPTADIEAHMKSMNFCDPWRNIVEIEASLGARILRVDSSHLDCNAADEAEQERIARRYWAGTDAVGLAVEILIEGPFRVTKVVRMAPAYSAAQ